MLLQSSATLIIGIILTNQGIPKSPGGAVRKVAEVIASTSASFAPTEIADTTTSVLNMISIIGVAISIVALIQLIMTTAYFAVITAIDYYKTRKEQTETQIPEETYTPPITEEPENPQIPEEQNSPQIHEESDNNIQR